MSEAQSPKAIIAESILENFEAVHSYVARQSLRDMLDENQALRDECERLRKALEVAGDDICSEYCGAGPCHKKCLAVKAALTPAAGGTRHG